MINQDFSDDDDIKREIRNTFMRSNILIRRYSRCSIAVKLLLFMAYWLTVCVYMTQIFGYIARVLFIVNSSLVLINV